ncbi:hypothetical protein BRC76_07505 [Halobacteriales archaeon QH_8_67_36]|nr:MAG: hypothetical protein BRC76_07505 [Halobacteriales archaeon QH_8_67_36]
MTAALTAQAGAVPGPVAQQETPTETPSPDEPVVPENETENETSTEDEPVTPENETPTEDGIGVPADNETDEANASLTFEDQESNGTTVTVSNVTLNQSGYVVIHDGSLANGETIDSVIGVSDYLPAGEHDNVTVTLFDVPGANYTSDGMQTSPTDDETANDTEPRLEGTQELTAMLHVESSVNQMGALQQEETNETPTEGEALTPETNETPTEGEALTPETGTETETPATAEQTPESDNQTMESDDQTAAAENQTMESDNQTAAAGNQTMDSDNRTDMAENQTFDFVETVSLLDPPVLVNDTPVTDTANVTVEDAEDNQTGTENGTATSTETENETTIGGETITETEDGTTSSTEDETETGTATPDEPGIAEGTESPTPAP